MRGGLGGSGGGGEREHSGQWRQRRKAGELHFKNHVA